ncbi:MAG: adenylosuccinate synthetase, partial [Patescibacteria group bacterium]
GGKASASWCNNGATKEMEDAAYANATVNDGNGIRQGVAIRRKGHEYGATTKRPRRTGWIDLPLLRYALDSGATDIILTKLDILTGVKEIKICYAYRYEGQAYNYGGGTVIKPGAIITKAIMDPEILDYCVPLYMTFPGWKESIKKAKYALDLPDNLIRILKYIFEESDVQAKPRIISVGPGPEETIFVGAHDLRLYAPKPPKKKLELV